MDKIYEIKGYAASLGLSYTKTELESIVHEAEKNSSSYLTFIYDVLYGEIKNDNMTGEKFYGGYV